MRIALLALLVAAAPTAAQNTSDKEPPRQPLNLRLDDAMRSPPPVIQFGPPPEKKDAAGGLPSLGDDARKIEAGRPVNPQSRSPFPRDSEMQNR